MYAYNPRKKSYRQLEKTLVGSDRWEILNNILKELTIKEGEVPKQHWMIVGPRGIGKSHLMTLLYYKIKEDRKLRKLWIPLLFPEELRMASSLHRFLERTVREILLELEQDKNQVSKVLKQKIETVLKVPLSERADSLFSLISWFHQETGKFIILIAENLQQLLGKKIPLIEQKKLRAFLQTSDALLIIGSATTIFNALHDHSHPFYHFFHLRRLEDLEFEDMKNLIVDLLSESGHTELTKEVVAENARLKTLYAFAGGNPRMAVFLSDILRTEVPGEMLSFMDNILDELTPYFEAILKEIPDYLEDIINTLATFEPAQSPKEIAHHLETPQTTIRNYLKQLKENGYVRIAFSKGKSNYYCLNEYLYRIWYQMRDSSHREETRWLMELLLMLYSPDTIVEERSKIETNVRVEKSTFAYEELIVQTADFLSRNPDYCKTIELCVDSKLIDEKRKIKPQKEKELFEKAISCIKNNQYKNAIEIYENILKINPKSCSTYGAMGDCYRRLGQYDEAEKYYQKAIKISPKCDNSYNLWGDFLRDQERYEEAIEKFKEAIKINPESYPAYEAMGDCLHDQERYEEAIEKFKQAIKINPKAERAYWAWGDCLRDQERYEEAIEKFKQAIKINPESYPAYGAMGDCFRGLGQYEKAEKYYQKAIKINPKYDDAYGAWGDCLRDQERYEEAIEKFKQAIKINPKTERAYGAWGDCLRHQERYEEAIEKFKQAIKINPKAERAYGAWGDCLRHQERYEEAIEKFKQAIKINPKAERAYGAWGDCLRDQERYEEAIEKFKQAIKINPKAERAYGAWGDCLRDQERYEEAIEKCKQAIKINSKAERAYWTWGACLRDQERYEEAIEKFKEAIKIDPESYPAYGAMGDCFKGLGRYDEAEKQYQKAIKINPNYEDAYAAWGDCLGRQKRHEEAVQKFNEAIKINPNYEDAYAAWGECLSRQERYEEAIEKCKKAIKIDPKSEYAYWVWGDSLLSQGHYRKAINLFEKHMADSKDEDVINSYGKSLMGAKRYGEALKQFERIIKIKPEYYKVYLSYGQLLEKMNDSESALLAYLKHINLGYDALSADFDFQKIHKEYILPLMSTLKPRDYEKQFYASKKERTFSEPQLSSLLILLTKYDTVGEYFQDVIRKYIGKSYKEKEDFNLLIFTIKLSVWLKLCEGNFHDVSRLMDLYIEYIKTLKKTAQKESEVSDFSLSLFKIQINSNIDSGNIRKILQKFENQKNIPFSNIFSKIWACLSEPDSVEAQRFFNEKAIAEIVKELKKKRSSKHLICDLLSV